MTLYHINQSGHPGRCQAIQGKCPYGRAEDHFDSEQAAYDFLGETHELFSSISRFPGRKTTKRNYLSSTGEEVSREQMLKDIDAAAREQNFLLYRKLRELMRDADFDREDEERSVFYEPMNISDAELLGRRKVRRGLNGGSPLTNRHELLVQLDNEGQYVQDVLSDEERGIIDWYKGTSYKFVNSYLRDGREGLSQYLQNSFSKQPEDSYFAKELDDYEVRAEKSVAKLDKLFEKAERPEKNKRVLYRVVNLPKISTVEELKQAYAPGKKITFDSYLSTSADSDSALLHSAVRGKKTPVVFEILTNKGVTFHEPAARGTHISGAEREVLLNRGSSFEVVGVGQETYESSYPGGLPVNNAILHAPRKYRFLVVQLRETENSA